MDILQVWYGTVCIAQADLISMNSAAVATANPNLLAAQEGLDTQGLGKALMILGTIAAVVLGGFGVLYVIRMTNIAVHRSRRRKRRTSRRRSR